jgi:hypothetical protein
MQLSAQMFMQRSLARQSFDDVHGPDPNTLAAQKQSPSVVCEQRQSPEPHGSAMGVQIAEKQVLQGLGQVDPGVVVGVVLVVGRGVPAVEAAAVTLWMTGVAQTIPPATAAFLMRSRR